jgi:hypothetical protein
MLLTGEYTRDEDGESVTYTVLGQVGEQTNGAPVVSVCQVFRTSYEAQDLRLPLEGIRVDGELWAALEESLLDAYDNEPSDADIERLAEDVCHSLRIRVRSALAFDTPRAKVEDYLHQLRRTALNTVPTGKRGAR